jgi:phosphoglycolate phosphatase
MTPVVWRIRASTTATGPNPTAEKNIGAKTMSGTTVVDRIAAHKAVVHGLGVFTGALTRGDLEQHPHSWVLEGVRELPSVLESLLVSLK